VIGNEVTLFVYVCHKKDRHHLTLHLAVLCASRPEQKLSLLEQNVNVSTFSSTVMLKLNFLHSFIYWVCNSCQELARNRFDTSFFHTSVSRDLRYTGVVHYSAALLRLPEEVMGGSCSVRFSLCDLGWPLPLLKCKMCDVSRPMALSSGIYTVLRLCSVIFVL